MIHWFKKNTAWTDGDFVCMKNPYMGDRLSQDAGKLMEALRRGKDVPGIRFLVLSTGEHNQIDILKGDDLLQPYYRTRRITVVGMADTKLDVERVLLRMMQDCVNARGDGYLRSYLEDRIRKEGTMA